MNLEQSDVSDAASIPYGLINESEQIFGYYHA